MSQSWLVYSVDCFPPLIKDIFSCSFPPGLKKLHVAGAWKNIRSFFLNHREFQHRVKLSSGVCNVIRCGSLLIWQTWNLDLSHRKSYFSLSAVADCCWQRGIISSGQEIYVSLHGSNQNYCAFRPPRSKQTSSNISGTLTDSIRRRPSHCGYRTSVGSGWEKAIRSRIQQERMW